MRRYLLLIILVVTEANAQSLLRAYSVLDAYARAAVARRQHRGTAEDARLVNDLVETNTRAARSEWDLAVDAGDLLPQAIPFLNTPNGVVFLNWESTSDDSIMLEFIVVGEARRITHLTGLHYFSRQPAKDSSGEWKIGVSPPIATINRAREDVPTSRERILRLLTEAKPLVERLCFNPGTQKEDLHDLVRRLNAPAKASPERSAEQASTTPVILTRVQPVYTAEAKAARAGGIVILELQIDEHGKVTDARITKSLPYGLDQAAVDAVKQWTFKPATKAGRPVSAIYPLTVFFKPPAQ